MSHASKDWVKDATDYQPTVKRQDHMTVQTGHDTLRPDNSTDMGRLYNRMNPTGVLGQAVKATGG